MDLSRRKRRRRSGRFGRFQIHSVCLCLMTEPTTSCYFFQELFPKDPAKGFFQTSPYKFILNILLTLSSSTPLHQHSRPYHLDHLHYLHHLHHLHHLHLHHLHSHLHHLHFHHLHVPNLDQNHVHDLSIVNTQENNAYQDLRQKILQLYHPGVDIGVNTQEKNSY